VYSGCSPTVTEALGAGAKRGGGGPARGGDCAGGEAAGAGDAGGCAGGGAGGGKLTAKSRGSELDSPRNCGVAPACAAPVCAGLGWETAPALGACGARGGEG
jgi:hypothetical protein